MILARDITAARWDLANRLVDTAVAVAQFVRRQPGCPGKDLMTEADSEDWTMKVCEQRAHLLRIASVQKSVAERDTFWHRECLLFGGEHRRQMWIAVIAGWSAEGIAFGQQAIATIAVAVAENGSTTACWAPATATCVCPNAIGSGVLVIAMS